MNRGNKFVSHYLTVLVIVILILVIGSILYSLHLVKKEQLGAAGKLTIKAPSVIKKDLPAAKKAIIAKLLPQFQARWAKLPILLEQNPAAFLRQAYPKELRDKLPPELKKYVEEMVVISGSLEVTHIDYFQEGRAEDSYALRAADGKLYSLYFAGERPRLLSGSQVRLHGLKVGNKIVLPSASKEYVEVIKAKLPGHTVKKVAVILFNFQNDPSQPFTLDFIRQRIFTGSDSVKAYYGEASYDQLILEGKENVGGDIYSWVTIPYTTSLCDPQAWWEAAQAAAIAAGADLTGYDNIISISPLATTCPFSGIAQLGGRNSYINADPNDFPTWTVAHELGHNFGAHHAQNYRCFNAAGQPVTLGVNCVWKAEDPFDPFDVMGSTSDSLSFHHMNNYHKRELNWLTAAEGIFVPNQEGIYEYDLTPLEQPGGGAKFIVLSRGSNTIGNPIPSVNNYYYLEYRQPYGVFDNFASADPVVNGVSLRIGGTLGSSEKTHLLDATPATDSFADAALPVGTIFNDDLYGISITTESVSANNAQVRITKGAPTVCYQNDPLLIISNFLQTGNAGQTDPHTYNVNIVNNANAACTASTFQLTYEIPLGWNGVLGSSTITLNPAQELVIPFTVTPPVTASPGFYTGTVTVTSSQQPDSSATAEALLYLYDCSSGVCVLSCGNDLIDPGENCANCADAQCAPGQICTNEQCVASPSDVGFSYQPVSFDSDRTPTITIANYGLATASLPLTQGLQVQWKDEITPGSLVNLGEPLVYQLPAISVGFSNMYSITIATPPPAADKMELLIDPLQTLNDPYRPNNYELITLPSVNTGPSCIDSDSTGPFDSGQYVVGGIVTVTTVSGEVNVYTDWCDSGGTDLFENVCDGQEQRAIDVGCVGIGPGFACKLDELGKAYCG